MMLFRIVIANEELPKFNQRKMERYCQKLLNVLEDDSKCEQIFKAIVDYIVSKGEDIDIENRKSFERKETTDYLLQRQDEIIEYLRNNGVQLD